MLFRSTTGWQSVPTRPRRPAAIDQGQFAINYSPGWGVSRRTALSASRTKSFSMTAKIVVPKGGAEGVIIHQAGHFGGWSFYAKNGKAKFAYNLFAIEITHVEAERAIPTGKHQVRM